MSYYGRKRPVRQRLGEQSLSREGSLSPPSSRSVSPVRFNHENRPSVGPKSEAEAWSSLDSIPLVKNRKRYKLDQVQDEDHVSLVINSLQNIHSSPTPSEKPRPVAVVTRTSKRVYGDVRSFLASKEESEESSVESDVDECDTVDAPQHFNELRSLGESQQFKDELEFLLPVKTKSALLSLAQALEGEMLKYVARYRIKDVMEHVIEFSRGSDADVMYIVCHIAYQLGFEIDEESPLWESITGLLSMPVVPSGSKLYIANFNEFYAISAQELALKLWCQVASPRFMASASQNHFDNNWQKTIHCTELLVRYLPKIDIDSNARSVLLDVVNECVETVCERCDVDDAAITATQILILCTLEEPWAIVNRVADSVWAFIESGQVLKGAGDTKQLDLATLLLGLCLNLGTRAPALEVSITEENRVCVAMYYILYYSSRAEPVRDEKVYEFLVATAATTPLLQPHLAAITRT